MVLDFINLNESDFLLKIDDVKDGNSLETQEKQNLEEKLSLNYIQRSIKMKVCPKCNFFLEKKCDSRINIKCAKCKFRFCWFCLNKWKNAERSQICRSWDCNSHLEFYELTVKKQYQMIRIKKVAKSILRYKIHYLHNQKVFEALTDEEKVNKYEN